MAAATVFILLGPPLRHQTTGFEMTILEISLAIATGYTFALLYRAFILLYRLTLYEHSRTALVRRIERLQQRLGLTGDEP